MAGVKGRSGGARPNSGGKREGAGRKPAIRVDGQLIFLATQNALTNDDMIGMLTIILGKEKVARFIEEQEVDFSYTFDTVNHLRGNGFFQRGMISIAFRLIPKTKTFEELKSNIIEAVELFFKGENPAELGFGDTPSILTNFELTSRFNGVNAFCNGSRRNGSSSKI